MEGNKVMLKLDAPVYIFLISGKLRFLQQISSLQ
jgi:hypothetical protein